MGQKLFKHTKNITGQQINAQLYSMMQLSKIVSLILHLIFLVSLKVIYLLQLKEYYQTK